MMKTIRLLLLMVSGLQFACGAAVEDDPAREERFLGADFQSEQLSSIQEASPQANGILRLVNQATYDTLDDGGKIGLDARAARNIVDYRVAHQGIHSLAELDHVDYVGMEAFSKLHNYALQNGFFSAFTFGVLEGSPQAEAILDIVNVAPVDTLDADVALERDVANHIVAYRRQRPIESIAELARIRSVSAVTISRLSEFAVGTFDRAANDQRILQQLAEEIGAGFNFERPIYSEMVQEIDAAPASTLQAATSFAANVVEQNRGGYFRAAEVVQQFSIVIDGELIGYVIHVEYDLREPIIDGGGVHLFLDTRDQVASSVSWWG